jgi:hypothetical protein
LALIPERFLISGGPGHVNPASEPVWRTGTPTAQIQQLVMEPAIDRNTASGGATDNSTNGKLLK